jgi:hypothetical protein
MRGALPHGPFVRVAGNPGCGIFDCKWRSEGLFLLVSASCTGGPMAGLLGKRFLVFVSVALVAGSCPAAPQRPFDDLHPAAIIISDHSLGAFSKARSIAESAGARGLLMFPSEAIFGLFPAIPESSSFEGLSVDICRARVELAGKGLSPVMERVIGDLFSRAGVRTSSTPLDETPVDETPIDDQVFRVPEDVIRATTPRGPRRGSPMEIQQRGINQNSEFLIGSVLINVIFPESDGGGENWTDQEIGNALSGINLALADYQEKARFVGLSFILNYRNFQRVPVRVEPIESNSGSDYEWIGEALGNLGYRGENIWSSAHWLNTHARDSLKTDWVFTAFVVDMSDHYTENPPSPDPGCWGGAGYVAYAYLGGPFLVVPFPACRYGDGLGFGQVFIHEMSHIFWALDEYVSRGSSGPTGTPCSARSGYLAVENRNTLFDSCQTTVPCIMKSGRKSSPLPICEYTMGQVGLADEEGDSSPDIYQHAPAAVVEFERRPGFSQDTLFIDDELYLSVTMQSRALPNRNPQQEGYRIDYAPPLMSGEYAIPDKPFERFMPLDGAWGGSEEKKLFTITGLPPGSDTITVRVTDYIDRSATARRVVFIIGMKYYSVSASVEEQSIKLQWITPGEVFGASFDVVRSDLTAGEIGQSVDTVTVPDEARSSRRVYSFVDSSIVAGHKYRYRVIGRFSFQFRGKLYALEYPSQEVGATIQVDLVSPLLPNPTRNRTSFTINVPKVYRDMRGSRAPSLGGAPERAPSSFELRTPLDVSVYNVMGQKIRTIYSDSRYGGLTPMTWDGTDGAGKAVSSGVYFISVQAGDIKQVKKVVLIR